MYVHFNCFTHFSFQVLRIFKAPRQFMETFQGLCKVKENDEVYVYVNIIHLERISRLWPLITASCWCGHLEQHVSPLYQRISTSATNKWLAMTLLQVADSLPVGASVPALGLSNKAVYEGERLNAGNLEICRFYLYSFLISVLLQPCFDVCVNVTIFIYKLI